MIRRFTAALVIVAAGLVMASPVRAVIHAPEAVASKLVSTTTLTSVGGRYGDVFPYTATVTGDGPVPTGSVQFLVNGAPDGSPVPLDQSGQAVHQPTYPLHAWSTVTAVYGGDPPYAPSLASDSSSIRPALVWAYADSSPNPQVAGQPIEFTVYTHNLSTGVTPSGTVTLIAPGGTLGSAPLNALGRAVIDVTLNEPGDYSMAVTFHDDSGDFWEDPTYQHAGVLLQHVVAAPSQPQAPALPAPLEQMTPAPAPPARCIVPKLRGSTLHGAKVKLRRVHCRLGKVTQKPSRRLRGRILSSKPKAGSRRPAGTKVAVVVGTRPRR